MKHTTRKKTFFILILIACVVLLLGSNTVFAEINKEYGGQDQVVDANLDSIFDDSTLLEMLAKLIYAVGRFLEWILGTIFKMLTGMSDFPWADRIVFNSVPLLDVNFINPAEKSFLYSDPIKAVLRNLYSTILALAVGFFGIVVLITAIKLVISTIASEKAKYKQAIVDWVIGFVMLFCIHYAISFIFYLNEQLVTVASKIVTSQLAVANGKIVSIQGDTTFKELVEKVREKGIEYYGNNVADLMEDNPSIVMTWQNLASNEGSKGLQEAMAKSIKWWTLGTDIKESNREIYENAGMMIYWATNSYVTVEDVVKARESVKVYNSKGFEQTPQQKYPSCISICNKSNPLFDFEGMTFDKGMTWNKKCEAYCYDGTESNDKIAFDRYNQAISSEVLKSLFKNSRGNFNAQLYNDFLKALNVNYFYHAEQSSTDDKVVEHKSYKKKGETTYIPEGDYPSEIDANYSNAADNYYVISEGVQERFGNGYGEEFVGESNFYLTDLLDDMIRLKSASGSVSVDNSGTSTGGGAGKVRLISDLASYFRNTATDKKSRPSNPTGLKNGKNINIQSMIMYAVLVAQSLILFIAYIKRLFYVVLLAMMAPIVVVFDFFQKFGK